MKPAQTSINTWRHSLSSDGISIDGEAYSGPRKLANFAIAKSPVHPWMEVAARIGWDIRFFEVVVEQNGGCCDMCVRAHGKTRQAECALTWESQVWLRRKAFCSRSVWRSSLEYARVVAHFYKTRSLTVHSKEHRATAYIAHYTAARTRTWQLNLVEFVISPCKILHPSDVRRSRSQEQDKAAGNEFTSKTKGIRCTNSPELPLLHLSGNLRIAEYRTSTYIHGDIFFTRNILQRS